MLTRARVFALIGILGLLALAWAAPSSRSDSALTPPSRQLGGNFGDDYFLANYTQLEAYWKVLDRESDRLSLVDIGRTEEGRTQWMAVISAPENVRHLDRYKEISKRLAHAEDLTDAEAHALAKEGKAIVWIDGGLHADEVLGGQQLGELVYELVSRSDAETLRFLHDVIVLAVPANPDGLELVANWYMREKDPVRRSLRGVPRLYQKYAGHDDNRDFYMSTQSETINMNRILYQEWFPQIVYDHHQESPPGTVMFAPPFRGPFNYVFDPLIPASINLVASSMQARFVAEGKSGVTMRSGSEYSTWWNGGLRTTVYFHNQIGLLTETIGSPTPMRIPYIHERQTPSADLPHPITPQMWRFRQSVDYSMTANRAVLDAASRNRETLLFNSYRMGKNSIERGSRDSWSGPARRLATLRAAGSTVLDVAGAATAPLRRSIDESHDADFRDARGYIIPTDQPDFLTATKFVNALIRTGITVLRAREGFVVRGRRYPAGSYVVRTAQAFRPHVLDMFEPQAYPDGSAQAGTEPEPPYDSAGWTLAYQMGVQFDRVLDAFDGPFDTVTGLVVPPRGEIAGPVRPAGYLFSHQENDAFIVVNRLLAAGEDVFWLRNEHAASGDGRQGQMYVAAKPSTLPILRKAAATLGVRFTGVSATPSGTGLKLRPVRIGLWDRYGGSVESGWVRWLLEQYEFPFQLVFPQTLDAGNLSTTFDVLIFPDGAIGNRSVPGNSDDSQPPDTLPPDLRARTGHVSSARTLQPLRTFVEDGGSLLAIGSSTQIGVLLGLPISTPAVSGVPSADGALLPQDQYYVPGLLLQMKVNNTLPLGFGVAHDIDVFFDNGPVFRLAPGAAARGVTEVASFAGGEPLRSGWASGQQYLAGGVAIVDASMGKGHVVLFAPQITFRAQSHAAFRLLFNGIYDGRAMPVRMTGTTRPSQ